MKKRTKVKDKSFILDKRKGPEGYSGSFCGKRGDGMACNYFGKNYIWIGVSQEKKKGPVLKSLVAKGDKIEFGYCYATTTSYSVIMSMYLLL